MKINLSELLLLINQESEKRSDIVRDLMNSSVIKKDIEIDGRETILEDVKEFEPLFDQFNSIVRSVADLKSKLAVANATTVVNGTDMTIVETMNNIMALRKTLDVYESLSDKRATKSRMSDGNGISSYYRIYELNYNIELIKQLKDKIVSDINNLEARISETNINTLVDI